MAGKVVTGMDNEQLASTLNGLLGFRPREGQVKAIRSLVVDRIDLILIAPTGWGKSVVFQSVPALCGGICLMIMPLNLLEEDQVSQIINAVRDVAHVFLTTCRQSLFLEFRVANHVC